MARTAKKSQSPAEKPKIKLPVEFDGDEAEFLRCMRKDFLEDQTFDKDNRDAGIQDLDFLVGNQWEPDVLSRRVAKRKPSLTINRLPAFVAQVVGKRLQNETQIRITPDDDAHKGVASVRQGLIRNVQKQSDADSAYDGALMGAVTCGIGNFQLSIDYESDEVWHQSLRIDPIPEHFAVIWDKARTDPTGKDASRCFVVESVPEDTFRSEYPWATPTDITTDRMPTELAHGEWYANRSVRIVDYWQVRERKRTIALMRSGITIDITDVDDPATLANIQSGPDGQPMIRDVYRKYTVMYRCSGADVLSGPYELPIDRVPVFRVPGWEVRIGDKVHRWGLIRHMKDPQRLHNFWRSAIAEKIMQSPKNTWLASDAAVAGRERDWRQSNTSDDPLLIWNAESGAKPERVEPIQVEAALIEQAQTTQQDLKDVSNIHEANLGMPSNEVSGRGIRARQDVSDTGTQIYHTNLTKAIKECGRICNDLIPFVYDTARVITVLGDDAQEKAVAINDITNKDAIDITSGKYRVTATTGPSYETKREENAESMMALAQAIPDTFALAPDLLVQAFDWPDADKLAARFRASLPLKILAPDEITPEMKAAAQQDQEQQAQQVELLVKKTMAEIFKDVSTGQVNVARAAHYQAETAEIPGRAAAENMRDAHAAASTQLKDTLAVIDTAHPLPTKPTKPTGDSTNGE